MRPLFPYFGGKQRAAVRVWELLGDPEAYLEPFAGSLAVLLGRPHGPRVEVVGDLDGLLINFWRAVRYDWESVAAYLDGPVAEVDVAAKHRILLEERPQLTEALRRDPFFHDTVLAVWWWQGISSWLGKGWGWKPARQRPHVDRSLKGCWSAGVTDEAIANVAHRLSNVILLAGDWEEAWTRVMAPSIVKRFDRSTGIFLDPPYTHGTGRDAGLYAKDDPLTARVAEVCLETPGVGPGGHCRIVLAGYRDEYPALAEAGWTMETWGAPNGYAQEGNERRADDVLYVSPSCATVTRPE